MNIPNGFYPVKNAGLREGYYISKDGKVGSTLRGEFKILSLRSDKDGYLDVALVKKNGKRLPMRVHRLMALTFLSNPNNFPVVNHINEIKDDNRLENIEWCSISYNTKHGYDVCGVRCARQRTVKITDVATNEEIIFDSVGEAASYLDVSGSIISRRVSGETPNPSSYGKLANIYFEYVG